MAEDEVEAVVRERQALGVGGDRADLEPEALGVRRSALSIPGEMSVRSPSRSAPRAPG